MRLSLVLTSITTDAGEFFHAAPNIDHSQDFVRRDIIEWMKWLRTEIGFDGWRLDFVRFVSE
jgi:alpha-amylase